MRVGTAHPILGINQLLDRMHPITHNVGGDTAARGRNTITDNQYAVVITFMVGLHLHNTDVLHCCQMVVRALEFLPRPQVQHDVFTARTVIRLKNKWIPKLFSMGPEFSFRDNCGT